MREIKFRAWDKKNKKLVKHFHITENGDIKIWDGSGWGENQYYKEYGIELMQFTGLKDKNGKEIYDGDIVMISDYYTEHITDDWQGPQEEFNHLSQVVFNSGMFGVDIKEKGDIYYPGFHSFGVLDDESEELEVIGNIFENPELINHPLT